MTILEALDMAHQQGYKNKVTFSGTLADGTTMELFQEPYFDPLFWEMLGKTMQWNEVYNLGDITRTCDEIPEWQYKYHLFIQHIAEGYSYVSFFENL